MLPPGSGVPGLALPPAPGRALRREAAAERAPASGAAQPGALLSRRGRDLSFARRL